MAEAAWPDAGVPDDPVVYADAGLRELGSAQCDLLFARLLTCPGIGAEQKEEMARAQADLRREAADPGQREEVAAACRQMTEAMEETLRRLAC